MIRKETNRRGVDIVIQASRFQGNYLNFHKAAVRGGRLVLVGIGPDDIVPVCLAYIRDIFDYIRECSGVTKARLASVLELSRPTVSNIVDELEKGGLIQGTKDTTNIGGRSAMGYACIPDAYKTVGLQLSGHHIRGVAVNMAGDIIGKIRIKRTFAADESCRKDIGDAYKELLNSVNLRAEDIAGVGVTVQALTDKEGTKITYISNESQVFSRYDQLLKYIPGQKRLFHDLIALGYNESLHVDENVFYLSVNNRIGSMILIENKVYYGSSSRAGEVGHIQLQHKGRKCYCGNQGCFDAYCNTNILRECAEGSLDDFFKGIARGTEKNKKCLQEYVEYLASAIFSIRLIFDGVIIIGGELGMFSEYYLDELRDILDQKTFFPKEYASEYLLADKQGEYAIAIGAAMYYNNHVLDQFE